MGLSHEQACVECFLLIARDTVIGHKLLLLQELLSKPVSPERAE